ncbi:hypothetical protein [Nocardiopsis tropica]|uniref:Transposase n=1 Tax=Nocardiopsis tropica TaxID=109330 RepID=A0ABU7KNJ3_9ACTN|nr:hypothetical protein [Nocardiopsis umidischolae]MEE2050866.1 hypothetical protein [Nocardiopsis umidischolae]
MELKRWKMETGSISPLAIVLKVHWQIVRLEFLAIRRTFSVGE